MSTFEITGLSNGIRVVQKQIKATRIVHCGFILDIGSRDEAADEQGLAHFWEHMAFKGTRKRKAFHIVNRLESVGGELNAYTTKEKICFYASVLDKHFEKAIELLTDITFESIFPESQIEREKKVILEEMAMYLDSPEDAIQDEFDSLIFKDHPLGNNILGTQESVRSFTHDDFKHFIRNNLNTERLVFSVVGPVPKAKVVSLAKKYLENKPKWVTANNRKPFLKYRPGQKFAKKNLIQAHCAVGSTAYSIKSDNRTPFFLIMNLLGGPGMNSRLNLALREKHGFVYSVDAAYHAYSDTGMFAIYFATDPAQLDKSCQIVLKELQKLKKVSMGSLQLHRAKEQLMGQLAMAEENYTSLMLAMGKSILDLDYIESLQHLFDQIKKVTSITIMEISEEIFKEDRLSVLKYKSK